MNNIITLLGRLTKDVELRKTQNDISVGRFSLAVPREYKKEDGTHETDFINCVAYRGLADTLQKYCHKGDLILVRGRLQNRTYEAQDGTSRYISEVILDKMTFVQTKKDETQSDTQIETQNTSDPFAEFGNEVEITEDDLPF